MLTALPRVLTGDNPFGVLPELDLLRPTRDVPNYSETMYFAVCDRNVPDLGLFLHTGRLTEDTALWGARTIVYLPGGELAVDRSHGRPQDDRGPATGNLAIRCLEPHRRWLLSYDGAAALTTRGASSQGIVGAGPATVLRFEVECEALSPVWDLQGAVGNRRELDPAISVWASGHHEQAFLARGSLTVGTRSWDINGVAHRDHSWGPRDMADFGADAFVALVFPDSGRVVQGVMIWNGSGDLVLRAFYVYENGRMELMSDGRVPRALDCASNPRTGLQVVIISENGHELVLPGEVTNGVTLSILNPNRVVIGAAHGMGEVLYFNEDLVRYTWPDGEVGYGHAERAIRLGPLP
jgi:hypothetical protein